MPQLIGRPWIGHRDHDAGVEPKWNTPVPPENYASVVVAVTDPGTTDELGLWQGTYSFDPH